MEIKYFPDEVSVKQAIHDDDPLLVLIAHDESKIIVSNIDDAGEHIILLRRIGHSEMELDKYFRIVLNNDGADWTFVCPSDYRGIKNKEYRILEFYKNGIKTISNAIKLLGYDVEICIPKRYRRHVDILSD